ncbi:MAG: ArnT family glycosyltransferase [Planctomycetota bacterium]
MDSQTRSHGSLPLALLAFAGLVLLLFRLHGFELPLEADECNYAIIAQRLIDGQQLYVDVWDHQPPGIYVLYATGITLFGDSPAVFRVMAMAFSLVSLVLIFSICRKLAGPIPAVAAAWLFAIVSSDPGTAGEGSNREIFMNTFVLLAWYGALRSNDRSGWTLFLSGLSLGIGSVIKTVLVAHWIFLACWLIVRDRAAGPGSRKRSGLFRSLVMLALGSLSAWLLVVGYFVATGRGAELLDAAFYFNLSYSGAGDGFLYRFLYFFSPERHPFVFKSALALWIGGTIALPWLAVAMWRGKLNESGPAVALLLGSYFAVCLPGRAWPHYYYLMMPALVIAVTVFAWQLSVLLAHRLQVRRTALLVSLMVAIVPVATLVTEYSRYLTADPMAITRSRYNGRDFWARAQGINVANVTDPGDSVFVFGNDAGIYYYANRRCASRYTMITGLQEGHSGIDVRRRQLIDDLNNDPPRVMIVLFDEPPFAEWVEFIEAHYGQAIGFDRHDKTGKPIMAVFARRDKPISKKDWEWHPQINAD